MSNNTDINIHDFPVLYYKAKNGKLFTWHIWTEDNIIKLDFGYQDGKRRLEKFAVNGKNIGHVNETSPTEQALAEATTRYNIKLSQKYSTSQEGIDNIKYLPMKAKIFNDYKDKIVYPVFIQPKYNGNRCLAVWIDNKLHLISRGNKLWNTNVPHIYSFLEKYQPKNIILDGELYNHYMNLPEINSRLKKYQQGKTEKLQFCVYDTVSLMDLQLPWSRQLEMLKLFFNLLPKQNDPIVQSWTYHVNSLSELYAYERTLVSRGYEGLIIRNANGKYEFGYESENLLKFKSFIDDEFEVVNYSIMTGIVSGCVKWLCRAKNEKTFTCSMKGSMLESRQYGLNGAQYIGKLLTVKYQGLNSNGIPNFPTGLYFRLENDLEQVSE